jgi:acyl-CoA thioesterase
VTAPTATTAFDRAIAVEPTAEGRYSATVDPGWAAPMGPNGGYLAAIVVRALEAALDPAGERRLRSLTCHYLRRPVDGPIELTVEQLRSGRRFTSARVTATQDGREVIAALAALSVPDLADVATWTPPLPDVDPPPAAGDAGTARGWAGFDERMPPLLQQVRIAPRVGGAIFSGHPLEPGTAPEAGGWIELAEPRGIDAAFVALCTDVWWPPSLTPLTEPAGVPTIDLTIHFRADLPREPLPAQPVLGQFRSSAAIGGLVEEDGVVFAADGTLLAQSRQLALFTPLG